MKPAAASLGVRNLARLGRDVGACVLEVAASIRKAGARLRPTDIRRKGAGDFVTTADLRAERTLRRRLVELLPEAGFLGEESAASGLDRDRVWVVDPIDGTSNFARGLPHHAVSVALVAKGDPVLAVLFCEPEAALYIAVRGGGARRNGRRIMMPPSRLDDGAIVGCQWHRGQQQLAFLARLQSRGNRIRTLGSTVTQLADVATGRLDANVQEQGRIWDIAAAGLVVEESGGRFTDWRGKRVFPLRDLAAGHIATVAAGPIVHRALVHLLKTA
ncbi:MAG: inositol monophosphatase [Planctomycetes bacterium]|nr:inositol monophosphatase [Planctomycetota bacterium]